MQRGVGGITAEAVGSFLKLPSAAALEHMMVSFCGSGPHFFNARLRLPSRAAAVIVLNDGGLMYLALKLVAFIISAR